MGYVNFCFLFLKFSQLEIPNHNYYILNLYLELIFS